MQLEGLSQFLADYQGMSLKPTRSDEIKIQGIFRFKVNGIGREIEDSFELEIFVRRTFPITVPKVREIVGKIPKTKEYHINPDGSFCLGSHLRLKKVLSDAPSLVSFTEQCLVPYLFNISIKLREGGNFLTGELAHGPAGILQDYMEMFSLDSPEEVIYALKLLGENRRVANKKICPCGCGRQLSRCKTHLRLNTLRLVASRKWFREHAGDLERTRFG